MIPARVNEILEREIERLDKQSKTHGLDLNDCKRLDLLIKAHKSFIGRGDDKSKEPEGAEAASTAELLAGLKSGKT